MDNRLVISERHGTIEINGRPAFIPVQPVPLAAPFNLSATSGDTVINASVDAYPEIVDSYNWYLDGVLIATTADGAPSYQYTGLTNGQEYRIGVSVTVNGEESGILDWTNHIYDTLKKGNFDLVMSSFNYHPQIYFYSGLYNRTYICWMGKDVDLNPCYVFYYDHDTGEISDSVLIGTADIGDNHNHGSIIADSTGTMYVMFERAHNDPYKVFKSTNPEDISSWTQLSSIGTDVAHPSLFVDTSDNIYAYGRGEHDRGVIFKSTDGGTTFSENVFANMDPVGDNRWFYHTTISSRKSQGMHIVVWLLNEALLTYPDAYYIHTMDGVTFGNIEYWESGGSSGFSKNIVTEGYITKAELDANFAVVLGADQSKYNTYQGGGLDIDGNPYMLMMQGDDDSVPQIENWRIARRNAGTWEFTDISSIVSLSDVRGASVTGIYRMEVIDSDTYRVWTYDFQGGSTREITQYITNDGGNSWTLERYLTRNSSFENPPGAVAITYNHFDAPELIFAWAYQNGADYSDIRTNIKIPALAVPRNLL